MWILLYQVDSNAEQLFGKGTGQNFSIMEQKFRLMYNTINKFVSGIENLFMNLLS